ncbi:Zinc finger BED domain-containing protein RICESLEEPER 3 [Rhynchospora pubera]|uniref:Zinc finger BED domain-containing protein RICESLEEPER 3 n=1 Tax=Rhynchospora pubera TaxID=906938 RepID=A0AAV8H956_9POAL|nr:Zinc finger BED domain-containing protein RICESLEEPER 3 [Rhynchospora pubera]
MASDHFANPNPTPIKSPSRGNKRTRSPSLDPDEADQPWSDQDPLFSGKEISTDDERQDNQIKEVMHKNSPINPNPEENQDRESQEEEKEVVKTPPANNQKQEEEGNNESVHSTDGGLLSNVTESLVKMVMTDEFPLHTITGIYPLSRHLRPDVPLPSISKLKKGLIHVHHEEKSQLKKILKTHRVCLSTETWVDECEMYHMSIRAHWINKDWSLCNKVLTFRWVPPPYPCSEETEELVTELGEIWENCLKDWGIESVLTITVGKTCTEAGAVEYLKNRTKDKIGAVLGHEFLHIRSCTHVIAEVLKEVLESEKETVRKIRDTIRFVDSSEERYEHFKKCAKEENLEHQGRLFVSIEPMWDSVYMMLEKATKLQKAFERLLKEDPVFLSCFYPPEEEDEKYDWWGNKIEKEVVLNPGPPTEADWENAKRLARLLRLFYKVMLRLSDPLFPTSNIFVEEVLGMRTRLAQLGANNDKMLGSLAGRIKKRFDEYWGDLLGLNPLFYVALVLDPRKKLKYIRFYLSEIDTDSSLVVSIVERVEATLVRLFEQYLEFEPEKSLSGSDSDLVYSSEDENYSEKLRVHFFKLIEKERKGDRILELKQYLTASCETGNGSFDILDWWKANCMRYPVLSQIAMDVLAIPASAAFYEQAFSTGFRELIWHKSRLSGELREALICGQDWFSYKKPPADFKESFIDEMAIEYGEEPED